MSSSLKATTQVKLIFILIDDGRNNAVRKDLNILLMFMKVAGV